ncbi:hypothetical protein [Klebsiella pasteurii]|uniref:hypothetical protein n=1 Tax=Klebsiella pasteurii TaxID=2587529 RepID=UPI00237A8718|nr:hypothetical protein [Klebsiella pasteurii]MDD9665655.1 hypothetical protein [Klebsiella pasteurii]MDD9671275.1 hypothetical protein [Klebsiella pasteurii]MDD9687375.1 hypothetical protein [Klebsiella pasteurii]
MLILLIIVVYFAVFIYEAYSLTLLWSWFVVPFGITDITFPWAIGLCCLASFFKGVPPLKNDENSWASAAKDTALVTIILVIGAIAHKFM